MPSDSGVNRETLISIGERLKEAREKKLLTIEQVQKATRIYSSILMALEEGRCDSLLTPTYVKGFLKKYAGHLGLDADAFLKDYSASRPQDAGKESILGLKEVELRKASILPKIARFLVILVILTAIISLIGLVSSKLKRARTNRIRVIQPAAAKVSKFAPPFRAIKTLPTAKAQSKAPLKLVLKAKKSVLVRAKRDGDILFARVMPKGMVETITAESRINLYIAKLEAIELILDGRSLGPLGRGIAKDVEITRSGVRVK